MEQTTKAIDIPPERIQRDIRPLLAYGYASEILVRATHVQKPENHV